MTLDHILTVGVAVSSAAAGIAWLISAKAKIKIPYEHGKPVDFRLTAGDDPEDNQLVYDGVDIWGTMALQSRWNGWAAAAACVAAGLQAGQAGIHWWAGQ